MKLSSSLYCRNCSSNCGASNSSSSTFRVTNGVVASEERKVIALREAQLTTLQPKLRSSTRRLERCCTYSTRERIDPGFRFRAEREKSSTKNSSQCEHLRLCIDSKQPAKRNAELLFAEFVNDFFWRGQLLIPSQMLGGCHEILRGERRDSQRMKALCLRLDAEFDTDERIGTHYLDRMPDRKELLR